MFLCGVQSFEGSNTCGTRVDGLDGDGVAVKVEEERSGDDEVYHVPEQVGYLVIED